MTTFPMEQARYWADIDTETGKYVDERGMRRADLATQDLRGAMLRLAIDEIEGLQNCFICIDCGRCKVDEDGCCATCGRDCMGFENGRLVLKIVDHVESLERAADELAAMTKEVGRLKSLLAETHDIATDERWTSRPPEMRQEQLARLAEIRKSGWTQPTMYPCGCSKHKINLGRCDSYKPYEVP